MTRRLKGTGTIFWAKKRKRWIFIGTYENSLGVKQKKWISAPTKKMLSQKLDEFQQSLQQNSLKADISLNCWLEQWLEVIIKPTVETSTYAWYKHITKYVNFTLDTQIDSKKIIQNPLGEELMNLITPIKIQGLMNNLLLYGKKNNRKLAPRTVNSFRRVLGMIFKSAIENNIIDKNNPVSYTKKIKEPKYKIFVLEEEEINRFLKIIKNGSYLENHYYKYKDDLEQEYYKKEIYILVYLGFATGMRISEICSLKWSDINYDYKNLYVKWKLKTENSERKIQIDNNTLQKLKDLHEIQIEYKHMRPHEYTNKNHLVFTNGQGKKLTPDYFRRNFWYAILEATNMPRSFKIHCMRHTHATILLKRGVSIKVISERLGHSTVEFTLKTYAHVLESMEESAANTWMEVIQTE